MVGHHCIRIKFQGEQGRYMNKERLCVIDTRRRLPSMFYFLDTSLQRSGYWQCFVSLSLVLAGSLLWFRRSPKQSHTTPAVPKVRGWLPGNIDVLWRLVYCDPYEYCGETLRNWSEIWGPTYDMNILWGHQVYVQYSMMSHPSEDSVSNLIRL